MSVEGFKGKGLWVWYLPATPTELGDLLTDGDFQWVAVKVHDGGSSWHHRGMLTTPWGTPAPSPDAAYVASLRALVPGLAVHGWGYVYCDGRTDAGDRGDGVPELEAAAATNAVHALLLDGYIADMEAEVQGHADLAGRFFDALDAGWDGTVGGEEKVARSYPLGVATWAAIEQHESYPWQLVVQRCDCLMPMVYRDEWNADTVMPVVALAANVGKPVAPVVSIFGAAGPVQLDVDRMAGWAWGVSAWELSGVARSAWWRDWQAPRGVPVTPPPVPVRPLNPPSDPGRVAACRDGIWKLAGDLFNAGGVEGFAVQRVIRWAKGELDLSQATRRELGIEGD